MKYDDASRIQAVRTKLAEEGYDPDDYEFEAEPYTTGLVSVWQRGVNVAAAYTDAGTVCPLQVTEYPPFGLSHTEVESFAAAFAGKAPESSWQLDGERPYDWRHGVGVEGLSLTTETLDALRDQREDLRRIAGMLSEQGYPAERFTIIEEHHGHYMIGRKAASSPGTAGLHKDIFFVLFLEDGTPVPYHRRHHKSINIADPDIATAITNEIAAHPEGPEGLREKPVMAD